MLLAVERERAKHLAHALSKVADLHEAGLDGVEQAHCDQQKDQDVVRQIRIDGLYDFEQHSFSFPSKKNKRNS